MSGATYPQSLSMSSARSSVITADTGVHALTGNVLRVESVQFVGDICAVYTNNIIYIYIYIHKSNKIAKNAKVTMIQLNCKLVVIYCM